MSAMHDAPTRVSVLSTQLSSEVLAYLRSCQLFKTDTVTALKRAGFSRNDDYDDPPRVSSHSSKPWAPHFYYEAYYHGLKSSDPHLNSHHPRKLGATHKPAAPKQLRAFLVALRDLNHEWLTGLFAEIQHVEFVAANPVLSNLFSDAEVAFADLSIQVHYGAEVDADSVLWHFDGSNSLLHMAISISAERTLHALISETRLDTVKELFYVKGLLEQGIAHRVQFPQQPGSVYLGSPFGFEHAVEYPKSSWSRRIVTVQCRILMTAAQAQAMRSPRESAQILRDQISPVLMTAPLRMPSLADVLRVEALL
eukprot:TRINITY_DN10047_c0_g1_i3.p1 TRINITY_DN10047_c0_g1~~TRINITY_DN10047_c0_g1_i3.p1  ORF type:complete len:309 (-),score=50.51 TRINITY_DN10047_c0_g1_i3:187-1113(-)